MQDSLCYPVGQCLPIIRDDKSALVFLILDVAELDEYCRRVTMFNDIQSTSGFYGATVGPMGLMSLILVFECFVN